MMPKKTLPFRHSIFCAHFLLPLFAFAAAAAVVVAVVVAIENTDQALENDSKPPPQPVSPADKADNQDKGQGQVIQKQKQKQKQHSTGADNGARKVPSLSSEDVEVEVNNKNKNNNTQTTSAAAPAASTQMSPCVEQCLAPMAKIDRSIANVYRNYDDVCERLEKSAFCAQRCGGQDQAIFLQYTTFYRMHCVEFEEALEEHLPCLREASYKSDTVCREKCLPKRDKMLNKREKQENICKNVECSMLCYFVELSKQCPDSAGVLIQLNARNADEMRRQVADAEFGKLTAQCQRIHSGDYVRKLLMDVDFD